MDKIISITSIKQSDISFERVQTNKLVLFKTYINGQRPKIYIDTDFHVALGIKENIYGKRTHPITYTNDLTAYGVDITPAGSQYGTLDVAYPSMPTSIIAYSNMIKQAFVKYLNGYVKILDRSDACYKYVAAVSNLADKCSAQFAYDKTFIDDDDDSTVTYTMVQFAVPKSCRVYLGKMLINEERMNIMYNKIMDARLFLQTPDIALTFRDGIPNQYNIKLVAHTIQCTSTTKSAAQPKNDLDDFDTLVSNIKLDAGATSNTV